MVGIVIKNRKILAKIIDILKKIISVQDLFLPMHKQEILIKMKQVKHKYLLTQNLYLNMDYTYHLMWI